MSQTLSQESLKKAKIGIFADDLGRKGMGTAVVLEEILAQFEEHFRESLDFYLIRRAGPCDHPLWTRAKKVEIPLLYLPKFAGFFSLLRFFIFTKERFDIVHFPRPALHLGFWLLKVFGKTKKIIVTFHGAPESGEIPIYETFVNRLNRWFIILFGKFFIDAVIVDSVSAKAPVASWYRINPKKIYPILLAAVPDFRAMSEEEKKEERKTLAGKYDLPFPYILTVSRLDPHKNVHRLIQAFSRLKEETKTSHKLVIVGGRHEPKYSDYVEYLVKALNLEEQVFFVPFIADEDMPALYALADIFVFVSLSEGFGLPLVEAMASETPVITSSISCLPEVMGDAAVLVNPYDVAVIKDAIKSVLEDNKLRSELIAKGRKRAEDFSWQKTAGETLELYRKVLNV